MGTYISSLRERCRVEAPLTPVRAMRGPLPPSCYYLAAEDPHFGPAPDIVKMYAGYSGKEVLEFIIERPIMKLIRSNRDLRAQVLAEEARAKAIYEYESTGHYIPCKNHSEEIDE